MNSKKLTANILETTTDSVDIINNTTDNTEDVSSSGDNEEETTKAFCLYVEDVSIPMDQDANILDLPADTYHVDGVDVKAKLNYVEMHGIFKRLRCRLSGGVGFIQA
jgi:hypothetical protein